MVRTKNFRSSVAFAYRYALRIILSKGNAIVYPLNVSD